MKPVSDVLLLNSSHPTTIEVHDEFGLMGSRVCDGEAKWESLFKVLGESFFTKGYWEWEEEVLGQHGPFLKGCKLYEAIFASLLSYDRHISVIRAFANIGVLSLTPFILTLKRFPFPFGTCIILLDYLLLNLFMMRWYRARKSYLIMQQSPHSHQVVETYSLHIIKFSLRRKGSL